MDFHFNIGAIQFGLVDIVIIALLLIALIIGLCQGFLKRFLGLVKIGVAGAGAYFLAPTVMGFFPNLADKITVKCIEICNSLGEVMTTAIPTEEPLRTQALEQGIGNLKVPGVLKEKIKEIVMNTDKATVGEAIGTELGNLAYKIVAIVATFLVLFIVLSLVFLLFRKALKGRKAVGAVDRILGAVVNLVICSAVICLVLFGIQALSSMEVLTKITTWFETNIGVGDETVKSLAKWVYENNPLLLLIGTK